MSQMKAMNVPFHMGYGSLMCYKGACTNDVSTEGGGGVSQFLTKGREVA